MAPFRIPLPLAAGLGFLALAGCGRFEQAERPAWRNQAEEACLAQHLVEPTGFLQPAAAIDGPGICGLNHPFRVYALANGSVRLNTASILDCSMIPTLDRWITDVVQPDAQARFGEAVVQIDTMGTYNCRGMNNEAGAKLSEHAFGNAMDVGGFVLASGRKIDVTHGWRSPDVQESAFLQDSHAGACRYFTTVLGPGSNIFHYNHLHLDLAMHGNTSRGSRRICKPVPSGPQVPAPPRLDTLPDPPVVDEEMDMAGSPAPQPSYAGEAPSIVAAVPPAPASWRPATPGAWGPVGEAPPRPPLGVAHGSDDRAEPRSPTALALAPLRSRPAPPLIEMSGRRPIEVETGGRRPPQSEIGGRRPPAPMGADGDLTALIENRVIR